MRTVDAPNLSTTAGPIVFFDGDCVLCNGFADFVLRRDRRRLLGLATLQGQTAASLLLRHGRRENTTREGLAASPDFKSIVLWDAGSIFRKSDAVIRVLSALGGVWRLIAALLRVVPRPLRDAVYDVIARNRFGWFGRRGVCRMPTEAERGRFFP